jgi:hypothetical protein
MMKLLKKALLGTLCTAVAVVGLGAARLRADDASTASAAVLKDRRIGYVTTGLHWAVYQSDKVAQDCPQGLNTNGPRETFRQLYPNGGPVADTQEKREALRHFPQDAKAEFPYILAAGKTSYGLNLDGKVGPNDYTRPPAAKALKPGEKPDYAQEVSDEKGIDNNLYKVIGCASHFRGPEGQIQLFGNKLINGFAYDRMMIELTNVDNLVNADNVDVTIYRGRDPLLLDATGEGVAPGGTQRIDVRYAKSIIQHLHGQIKDGILTTDPVKEGVWPWAIYFEPSGGPLTIKDMRFKMKVSPTNANGLLAGYTTVDSWYGWVTAWSTHHLSYGQLDPHEFYWALRDNADAYPDKDGHNTAISSALKVDMAQVYIIHPDEKVADSGAAASSSAR